MTSALFYPRLAAGGIKKNSRTYIPYILTCSGMIMVYYIVSFLSLNELFGGTTRMLLSMGCAVMIIFSAILLFYTNTFLMRRRRTEFGLYNILGMGKREIAFVLVWETVMIYFISVITGIGCGILFSKLAELTLVKMLKGTSDFVFSVQLKSVVNILEIFAVIFFLITAKALLQIHFSNPIELLRSENTGEKPPRANYLIALIGAVILGFAYYLAVSIDEPMQAIMVFLAAVIMVIGATYLLFVAGSVVICRVLQKNKNYYYKTNHFVSVSQMAYRMKRNGAGLASICILSTMVLVTLSSTICLYIGEEDIIKSMYPNHFIINTYGKGQSFNDEIRSAASEAAAKQNLSPENIREYSYLGIGAGFVENKAYLDSKSAYSMAISSDLDVRQLYFISADDYNALTGENESLSENEAILISNDKPYGYDSLEIDGFGTFSVKKSSCGELAVGNKNVSVVSVLYMVVPDGEAVQRLNEYQCGVYGENCSNIEDYFGFDLSCDDEMQLSIYNDILDSITEIKAADPDIKNQIHLSSKAQEKEEFLQLYGGLFFLGIVLGTVFICAAVLIMYYKQISEGFEDKTKFTILQKVGMTKTEIRKSINSQVLTVFFLPLIAAGIHTAFAFPLLTRLLKIFGLTNTALFAKTSLCCFGAFALLYIGVYFLTSRSYYNIVSSDT